jgi:hypothetical protein
MANASRTGAGTWEEAETGEEAAATRATSASISEAAEASAELAGQRGGSAAHAGTADPTARSGVNSTADASSIWQQKFCARR